MRKMAVVAVARLIEIRVYHAENEVDKGPVQPVIQEQNNNEKRENMPAKSKQRKFTTAQIKEHIRNIQKAIEKHKRENKSEHFTAVTPEEIEKKLKRVNSPMIILQAWSNTTPGATFDYTLGIYNPDPTLATRLFAHVWVGSGNVDPTVGTFLLNVDTRFPRLTEPAFTGLAVAAGKMEMLNFTIKVPSTVEKKTNYIGNSCLMQFNFVGIGTYLDRGVFVFAVF